VLHHKILPNCGFKFFFFKEYKKKIPDPACVTHRSDIEKSSTSVGEYAAGAKGGFDTAKTNSLRKEFHSKKKRIPPFFSRQINTLPVSNSFY